MNNLAQSDKHVNSVLRPFIIPSCLECGFFDTYEAANSCIQWIGSGSPVDWLSFMRDDLTAKGYRCIPHGAEQPLVKYIDGQTYPASGPLWQKAELISVALPPDVILIDLDGYKQNAATVAEIANALGITEAQLDEAKVQERTETRSIHWLFQVPPGHRIKTATSEWLPSVDIKVGNNNGLVNVKPHKAYSFPDVKNIPMLDMDKINIPLPVRSDFSNIPLIAAIEVSEPTKAGMVKLDEMIHQLAKCGEGDRNHTLNNTAVRLGHYVAGGELPKELAVSRMLETAKEIGLTEHEAQRTIQSGLKKGMSEPRKLQPTAAEIFAQDMAKPTPRIIETHKPESRTGHQYLISQPLIEHFSGCVYVTSLHRVLTPQGAFLKPEQFNATFGGYVFAMDDQGNTTTRKAFEAFTENQGVTFPKAYSLAFRPEFPQSHIFTEAGVTYVNSYVPLHGERSPGDVSPFLEHMEKLIPDKNDRNMFMSWIASCIQNPGKKHQWSPVLVGTEGNGKSLIGKIVRYALGDRYTAEPRPNQLGEKFNSWIENKLFAVIEEIHMNGRRAMLDAMKPLITNTVIELEAKGRDSYDADNRCNILLCTNHKDAVIKTVNDRRYSIFFTGQQSKEDKIRDGMNSAYFSNLWAWLKNGGYAKCAYYFDHYPITVDVMGDAPATSSTAEAILQTMGGAEQEILEAVEMGLPGFTSGMIRSDILEDQLKLKGYKLTPHRRKTILGSLDYIPHPVNGEGKVRINGKTVRVYVKKGHPACQLSTSDIALRLSSPFGDVA